MERQSALRASLWAMPAKTYCTAVMVANNTAAVNREMALPEMKHPQQLIESPSVAYDRSSVTY